MLQQWKRFLQVGDVVDAQDKKGHWYDAVITSVHPCSQTDNNIKFTPTGTGGSSNVNNNDANKLGLPRLGVHFKGWSTEFDEEISPLDVEKKIQVSGLVNPQQHSLFNYSMHL